MLDTRKRILNTSLNLFLQKSYKEVTLQEILRKTVLSKGTFYYYFNSKEKVFEEVLDFFLSDMMRHDYSKFPQDTLKGFYSAFINDIKEKSGSASTLKSKSGESFKLNHYYLIFDALKMLPSFKKKHFKYYQEELKSWETVISNARAKREITSQMSDEQIAQVFIFLGDGFGIHLIMNGSTKKIGEIKPLYDGFYNGLKS